MKAIYGFDLDDVLLNFMEALNVYYNDLKGTKHERSHYSWFELEKLWGCPGNEALAIVHDFYNSPGHLAVEPVRGAIEGIRELSEGNDLYIITAKPETLRGETMNWLDKYFPKMFKGIHFTNHYSAVGIKRMKADICKELGIQAFVEDSLENSKKISAIGIPVILHDTPWNQSEPLPNITRAHSWPEIVRAIKNKTLC